MGARPTSPPGLPPARGALTKCCRGLRGSSRRRATVSGAGRRCDPRPSDRRLRAWRPIGPSDRMIGRKLPTSACDVLADAFANGYVEAFGVKNVNELTEFL